MNSILKAIIIAAVVGFFTYMVPILFYPLSYAMVTAAWTSAITSFIVVLLLDVLEKYKLTKK